MRTFKIALLVSCLISFTAVAYAAKPVNDYTHTRYPIVLVHGMLGFDKLFDSYTYWYRIVNALQRGGADVFVLTLSPLNSSVVRGEQALEQLETLQAIGGYEKFNLIGHSQGGLDIRYVAAMRPDMVASITTVSTPHQGAALADYLITGPISPGDELFMDTISALGPLLSDLSNTPRPSSLDASLRSLSSASAVAFNAKYPDGLPANGCGEGAMVTHGRYNFSWGGVGVRTNAFDWLDRAWVRTSGFYHNANDGLVSRCSNHFGKVLRDDYLANHLDVINQMLGMVGHISANPLELYRVHANRLKQLGL